MAADHREAVERGLRLKKIGNDLLDVLGGRTVHPINVTVGGFYRAPKPQQLKALLPDLKWGLQASIEVLELVSGFDFPDLEMNYDCVSLKHPKEFPMNEGNVCSSKGLEIPVEKYEEHYQEVHAKQSRRCTACDCPK